MDITGILVTKTDIAQVSEKFRKRDFTIKTEDQYPQRITFQLTQERCELIDKFNPGDIVKTFFNLRGREWTNPQGEVKYFNTIEAWKIEGISTATVVAASTPAVDLPF